LFAMKTLVDAHEAVPLVGIHQAEPWVRVPRPLAAWDRWFLHRREVGEQLDELGPDRGRLNFALGLHVFNPSGAGGDLATTQHSNGVSNAGADDVQVFDGHRR